MDDLKGIIHDVGKKPRSLVENGAVVEPAISGNHRNVVQVPVIVEYKTVNFKLRGQTLGGQGQTRDICGSCFRGALSHREYILFVTNILLLQHQKMEALIAG